MQNKLILVLFCLGMFPVINAQEVVLKKGMKIQKSIKVKSQMYTFISTDSAQKGVIEINTSNIVVDFNNAILKGSMQSNKPDQFSGFAIVIRDCRNVTIRNLIVKGYKIALYAINVENLTISNSDFSYNYRKRLNSTQEREDISDWMSYHQNEKDQWLRYGAAIYLRNCNQAIVNNNKVTGGQNALMMTNCIGGLVYNNDFSFNSGIGIGMYRCEFTKVVYNKINFNVRGYSHQVYHRGQDSAGILVYEQSSNNLFYKNSATHSGDGFFLWAGQTTMETGKGGSNNNAIIENDFSYAPTNGIEITFSSNYVYRNRIYECDHGIWGGYSYNTRISKNRFRNNRIGIAIEHGQDNVIDYNIFFEDRTAINLWSRKEQPADWGYSRNRDTRSRNYVISHNSFNNHQTAIRAAGTTDLYLAANTFSGTEEKFRFDSTVSGVDSLESLSVEEKLMNDSLVVFPSIKEPLDPFRGAAALAGRKNIRVTEWGPYDFRYPLIWNNNPVDTGNLLKFEILGPAGSWKLVSLKGVTNVSAREGKVPAEITAEKTSSDDISVVLEYTGGGFVDQFGEKKPANRPYKFSFNKFFQPINFHVRWYSVDTSIHDPVKTNELFPPNVRMRPIKMDTVNKIHYAWWGGIKANDQAYKQFLTIAEGTGNFDQGNYEIGLTWDDAVRLYIDDKLVIDEWEPSRYTFDESPHKKITIPLSGSHKFRIEHVELGGFATLSLKVQKAL